MYVSSDFVVNRTSLFIYRSFGGRIMGIRRLGVEYIAQICGK